LPISPPALFPFSSSSPLSADLFMLAGFSPGLSLEAGNGSPSSDVAHTTIAHLCSAIRTPDPSHVSAPAFSAGFDGAGAGPSGAAGDDGDGSDDGGAAFAPSSAAAQHPYRLRDREEEARLRRLQTASRGFISQGPYSGGESGGPVLSLACEMLGVVVAQARGGTGGIFVRLTDDVQALVVRDLLLLRQPTATTTPAATTPAAAA
jgi:hypothetical protein